MINPEDQNKLQLLAKELGDDLPLMKKIIADYKAGGIKNLAQDLPGIVQEVQEDIGAITAAVPAIKAGYKTTEFWLVLAVLLGNAGYLSFTGKVLPFDLNATLAALVSLYTLVRAAAKKPTAPAPPQPLD